VGLIRQSLGSDVCREGENRHCGKRFGKHLGRLVEARSIETRRARSVGVFATGNEGDRQNSAKRNGCRAEVAGYCRRNEWNERKTLLMSD
jgi:hypothetical protein